MRIIPILIFLAFSISCKDKAIKDENYYFNLSFLFTERTFCYTNQNDTSEKSYWKMKTYLSNNDTFLLTKVYDSKKRMTDSTIEMVSNGNAIIVANTMVNYDQVGNKILSDCKIVDSLLFVSNLKKGEILEMALLFKDPRTAKDCGLFRERSVKSIEGNQKIFYNYLTFKILDTEEGYSYEADMTYEKNKGLIAYEMTLPDGTVKSYVLTSIE